MNTLTNGQIFLYETLGTATLLLLGAGVVATAILRDSKGFGGGWLLINFGWGLGVYMGVYVAFPSGAHLNPAVTVSSVDPGQHHRRSVDLLLPRRVPRCLPRCRPRWAGLQAALRRRDGRRPAKLAVFSTGPAIRSNAWNLVTEIIGTFVLVFVILTFGGTPSRARPAGRRPAGCRHRCSRSVAPPATPSTRPVTSAPASRTPCCRSRARVASDWSYSWMPVVGPLIGGDHRRAARSRPSAPDPDRRSQGRGLVTAPHVHRPRTRVPAPPTRRIR